MAIETDDLGSVEEWLADDGSEPLEAIFTDQISLTDYLKSDLVTAEKLSQIPAPNTANINAFVLFMQHQREDEKIAHWCHNLNYADPVRMKNPFGDYPMYTRGINALSKSRHEQLLARWENFVTSNTLLKTLPESAARQEALGCESMDILQAGMYNLVREVLEYQNSQLTHPSLFVSDDKIIETFADQSRLTWVVKVWAQLHPQPAPESQVSRQRILSRMTNKFANGAGWVLEYLGVVGEDDDGNLIDGNGNKIDESKDQAKPVATERDHPDFNEFWPNG